MVTTAKPLSFDNAGEHEEHLPGWLSRRDVHFSDEAPPMVPLNQLTVYSNAVMVKRLDNGEEVNILYLKDKNIFRILKFLLDRFDLSKQASYHGG